MTGQAQGYAGAVRPRLRSTRPIPYRRLVTLELRKCFDTRASRWLMAGMVFAVLAASIGVIAAIPAEDLDYPAMSAAAGVPTGLLLPIMASLLVTSEWSQRTVLSTFTLVPDRTRVISAKAAVAVIVGVVSVLIAMAVAALGTSVGGIVRDVDPAWVEGVDDFTRPILGHVLGLVAGFALGVLIRNSAGAVVAYVITSTMLPGATEALAEARPGFEDLRPWVDFVAARGLLYNGSMSAADWGALAVSGSVWLVLPTVLGLWLIRRSELA